MRKRYLGRDLALHVLLERRWGTANNHPVRSGELCVELGYLSENDVQALLEMPEQEAGEIRDILAPRLAPASQSTLVVLRSSLAVAVLVVTLVSWWWAKDLQTVGSVASIAALVWAATEALLPVTFRIQTTFSGWLRWVSVPLLLFLTVRVIKASFYAFQLLQQHKGEEEAQLDPAAVASLLEGQFWLLVGVLGILALMLASLLVAAFWRNFELRCSEKRSVFVRRLVRQYVASATDDDAAEGRGRRLEQLLSSTACALEWNPWQRLVGKIVRWYSPSVSLWYLRADPAAKKFSIVAFAAPAVGEKALDQFKKIKEGHQPCFFDRERYKKPIAEIRAKGWDVEKTLPLQAEIHEYLSVAGYVYETQRALVSGDARKCAAFDDSYRKLLVNRPREVPAELFDTRSFAAYPVFDQVSDAPAGVLVALKNLRRGFTRQERSLLVSCARLVGLLLGLPGASRFKLLQIEERPDLEEGQEPLEQTG